jgi:hypothetical protein
MDDYEDYEGLERTGNPEASEAMSLAADYRREGYDPSEALSQAWADVKGGNMDNPKADWNKYLMYGGAAYGLWVVINYFQTKQWNFTPWRAIAGNRQVVSRMIAAPVRTNPGNPLYEGTTLVSTLENVSQVGTGKGPATDLRATRQLRPAVMPGPDDNPLTQREAVSIIEP